MKKIKKAYQEIKNVCEKYKDIRGIDGSFTDISDMIAKANNHLTIIEWKEKYNITINNNYDRLNYGYVEIASMICFIKFNNAKEDHKKGQGRSISWEDNGKQPKNEWCLNISFSEGAFIFGDDYPTNFFQKFWGELKKYEPDFIDSHNDSMYWKLQNASKIYNDFQNILAKYRKLNEQDKKKREIKKLKEKLNQLNEE